MTLLDIPEPNVDLESDCGRARVSHVRSKDLDVLDIRTVLVFHHATEVGNPLLRFLVRGGKSVEVLPHHIWRRPTQLMTHFLEIHGFHHIGTIRGQTL